MNIVTALQCEADPLIDRFDLSGVAPSAPFQMYRNDSMRLIISQPGPASAAAAAGYLAGRELDDESEDVWLNIGIAGHPDRAVGEAVYAGKIINAETDEAWYPQPVHKVEPDLETVVTVQEPVRHFDRSAAYDMEAAGFYSSVMRFTTVERAHCLKVVSDGDDQSPMDLDRVDVRSLIEQHLDEVERFLEAYGDMTERDTLRAHVREVRDRLAEQAHFTQAEMNQLEERLERWSAVHEDRDVRELLELDGADAEAILSRLESDVAEAPVTYEGAS
jgi:hypothetical protein